MNNIKASREKIKELEGTQIDIWNEAYNKWFRP
jgi:hypothetical protein